MVTVLIVDDSPAQVFALKALVEEWGHEVLIAENGDQALEIARQDQPDVILMDIIMPGMSGFQATRTLSKDPATRAIPIIFVSTKKGESDRVWGMRQGAIGYITKPVNPDLLLSAITDAVAA